MKIAILSGKGGAGKTFIAVNLADVANKSVYIDCDVEEPNGHLFFQPTITQRKEIFVDMPKVDEERCTGCKKCVEFCRFNALAYTKKLIIFEDICHSCGGCKLVCPEKAIYEEPKKIGVIEKGYSQDTTVATGILDEGIPSGV